MSIVMNTLPEASEITNCIALLESLTTPLMATLTSYRNYFVEIGRQSDALYASSLKVFEELDKQSKNELCRLERLARPRKQINNHARNSVSPKPATVQPSRTSVKIPCNKPEPTLSSKMAKELVKSSQKIQKAFVCFLCFRARNGSKTSKSYSWQCESFYLSHLKKEHGLVPNFELAMLSVTGIPFSHAYFHGQLVSLFRNSSLQEYLHIIACYKQEAISKIYACGCMTEEDPDRALQDEPIFINSSPFYSHIALKHDRVCPEGSSHKLFKYGKDRINFFKANKSSRIYDHPRVARIIGDIEKVVEGAASYSITSFLVESSPLCRLELISRLRLQWKEAFLPLPNSAASEPTLSELKSYSRSWKDRRQMVRIEDASEEDNDLINFQISLLDPSLYLCGECSYRAGSQEQYISHIYLEHKSVHLLNSHRFLFLTP